LAKIIPLQF